MAVLGLIGLCRGRKSTISARGGAFRAVKIGSRRQQHGGCGVVVSRRCRSGRNELELAVALAVIGKMASTSRCERLLVEFEHRIQVWSAG